MLIKCIPLGGMGANCYVVACDDTKEALVIDPGGEPRPVLSFVEKEGLKVKYIVNTHGHIDHIMGNDLLKQATGARVLIHELDAEMLQNPRLNLSGFMGGSIKLAQADQLLTEGDTVEVGKVSLEVIHTPGHTRGGICLKGDGVVFTGDTLFSGSIGRSDFPGGSAETLINSIKTKLLPLPDDTAVYPGHMQESTMGEEKKYNPFLR
ncbi:MAG: MBL fold metallo-hydrolase [Bacillota bacterium]